MPKYLYKRNKASIEGKINEVNFNEIEPKNDTTYLEVADFIEGTMD